MKSFQKVKRIAILGPESSGKTTLCSQLAGHFNTSWVPEFARGYITSLDRPYTAEDILHCAKEQLLQEEQVAQGARNFLFCDTEFILAKVWSLDVFGTCPEWILEKARNHVYDLYILTTTDLPFVPDPVRENPYRREELYELYRKELDFYGYRYEIISGIGKKRFQSALKAIDHSA